MGIIFTRNESQKGREWRGSRGHARAGVAARYERHRACPGLLTHTTLLHTILLTVAFYFERRNALFNQRA